MNVVDSHLARNREEQRTKQHDRRIPAERYRRTMKTTIDTAMNILAPPSFIAPPDHHENPDWVKAQAIDVAAPMMKMIAPASEAVSISILNARLKSKRR